jgi:hypothetical protein
MRLLSISGLRDVLVWRYVDWQQTQVEDKRLKAQFQKLGEEVLDRGCDLETVYEEKTFKFLKGIVDPGTIIRFSRDIPTWAGLQN